MLYEKLSTKDINTFCSYIQTYGASCDASIYGSMANPAHILRVWDDAKSAYLYKAFGEKLILEKEVELKKAPSELRNDIAQSLDYGELGMFKTVFKQALIEEFGCFTDEYYFLMRLFDKNNLADNIAHTLPSKVSITFKNGCTVKLNNTAKTIKLMGKIAKMLNLEKEFETFRLKHSLILNQKKVKGTLCLSIHPMDYLTMSDNANGWTSCMSWQNDGDYRMGTVEMMNSPNTIVAYIRSDDKTFTWDNQEWNSKLWRTLIVVDPNVIVSVKNYPYENIDIINHCIEWLRELTENNLHWSFPHPIAEIREDEEFKYANHTRHLVCRTHKMYNDFGCSTHYGILSDSFGKFRDITYSGARECMWCGTTNESSFYGDANFVFCENCSDGGTHYVYCDECGKGYCEDEIYWVGDTPLCGYCFDEHGTSCEISQEYIFQNVASNVYLARVKDNPNHIDDYFITVDNDYVHNDKHYEPAGWLSSHITCKPHYDERKRIYYWNIEDLTEEGLNQYFGISDKEEVNNYLRCS